MTKGSLEIRHNDDGTIDEIVASGVDVHIEQMSSDGWYVGMQAPDGRYWQFWMGAKNRRSAVEVRHTEFGVGGEQER